MICYEPSEIGYCHYRWIPQPEPPFLLLWDKMTETAQLLQIATPVVNRYGCDIVQLAFVRENSGWILRLLIEKPDSDPLVSSGVDHDICSGISREFGELLEGDEVIDKHFILEVSSPGIERPLTKIEDFGRFIDRQVKIKMRSSVDGKRKMTGVIVGAENGVVNLKLDGGKKNIQVRYEQIAKANLVFDVRTLKKKLGER